MKAVPVCVLSTGFLCGVANTALAAEKTDVKTAVTAKQVHTVQNGNIKEAAKAPAVGSFASNPEDDLSVLGKAIKDAAQAGSEGIDPNILQEAAKNDYTDIAKSILKVTAMAGSAGFAPIGVLVPLIDAFFPSGDKPTLIQQITPAVQRMIDANDVKNRANTLNGYINGLKAPLADYGNYVRAVQNGKFLDGRTPTQKDRQEAMERMSKNIEQIKQTINKDPKLKPFLKSGTLKQLNDHQNQKNVANSNADILASEINTVNTAFETALAQFEQGVSDSNNTIAETTIPYYAQFVTMYTTFLHDVVTNGSKWGISDAVISTMHDDLQKLIPRATKQIHDMYLTAEKYAENETSKQPEQTNNKRKIDVALIPSLNLAAMWPTMSDDYKGHAVHLDQSKVIATNTIGQIADKWSPEFSNTSREFYDGTLLTHVGTQYFQTTSNLTELHRSADQTAEAATGGRIGDPVPSSYSTKTLSMDSTPDKPILTLSMGGSNDATSTLSFSTDVPQNSDSNTLNMPGYKLNWVDPAVTHGVSGSEGRSVITNTFASFVPKDLVPENTVLGGNVITGIPFEKYDRSKAFNYYGRAHESVNGADAVTTRPKQPGENGPWMSVKFHVDKDGDYNLRYRAATTRDGNLSIAQDGAMNANSVKIQNTSADANAVQGDLGKYGLSENLPVHLTAGDHSVEIMVPDEMLGNMTLDRLEFVPVDTSAQKSFKPATPTVKISKELAANFTKKVNSEDKTKKDDVKASADTSKNPEDSKNREKQ
ncbi:insecticidal delta-endotoxin Cry8Ea1 family protein [Bacillus wiedmannii]|uniref:insecticidal delta-endotoxin Cry8Ea1 family protein n=1 Tax=Bacillus wiedmannii TaxID=1890302 RepID=UPI00272EED43|nr:insecticidal delta-endotoxin Cry8Ea1 family protein [Bacillus wiedmannii]MDP1459844.1 insecticidal delta-endotoxin Cry8Ea1 family protein [Bacillus wiedmannii]